MERGGVGQRGRVREREKLLIDKKLLSNVGARRLSGGEASY